MREIMALADRANQYIDHHKPWVMAKDEARRDEVVAVCTQGLNLFRALVIMLKPVLPALADVAEQFLGQPGLRWADLRKPLLGARIDRFKPLMTRVDEKSVRAMVEASRESLGQTESDDGPETDASKEITIEDFLKIDLRVARIVKAEPVEAADKLIRLELDPGDGRREVLAGIRTAYKPEDLVDRLVVVVANLRPRKMRFGTSQGMILAAGPGGEEIFLLSPDAGAQPGMKVT
jgi:methionyl-tRNA synthetase